MSDAQNYYNQCLEQGHSPDQAEEFTRQYFPDFALIDTANTLPPTVPVQSVIPEGNGVWSIQTANNGLLFTKLASFLMKLFSLGIAAPWAECMVIEKWASHVRIDGRSIKFTGNASGLFKVWIKVFLLSVITFGIYYLFIGRKAVAAYIDSHITWA